MKKLIAIAGIICLASCGESNKTETTTGTADSTGTSTSTQTTTGTTNTAPDSTTMYDQQLSDTNSVSRDSIR